MAGGWQLDGTFLRANNDYTADPDGSLWQQDLSASIKIIANRHDFHDQIMGQGIQATLNLDGLNSMRSDLKMGGFKITGLADGVASNNAAAWGQIAGSFDWEVINPGELRLLDRDLNVITTIILPLGSGGGGGSGTVTAITIGAGLSGASNPIQTTGDISLEELGTEQVYTGGISGLTVDKHGRVTQVVTGAYANTNLGNAPSASTVKITSSTGTNTTIPAAVAGGNAGVMTGSQAQQLEDQAQQLADLIASGAAGMIPPTQLFGINSTPAPDLFANAAAYLGINISSTNTISTWQEMFSDTGAGTIEYLGVAIGDVPAGEVDVRLLIDGVIVWTGLDVFNTGSLENDGFSIIGAIEASGVAFGQVKFDSSFKIQMKIDNNGGGFQFLDTYYRYYLQ